MPTFCIDRGRPLEEVINDGKSKKRYHPIDRAQLLVATHDTSFNFRTETIDVLSKGPERTVRCRQCITHKFGKSEIYRLAISAWYEIPQQHKLFSQPLLVLLADSASCAPERLSNMYWHSKQARKRFSRLDALPWWIFLDIMYAFNDWSLVVKLMQQEMAVLDKRFMRDRPKVDILTFTQMRHSFRTTLIALRETHSNLSIACLK